MGALGVGRGAPAKCLDDIRGCGTHPDRLAVHLLCTFRGRKGPQKAAFVLAPGAIEAALASADETAGGPRARSARGHYEAERARRQYDAVEPEHRLVAATLEERWNAALERVKTGSGRSSRLYSSHLPLNCGHIRPSKSAGTIPQ